MYGLAFAVVTRTGTDAAVAVPAPAPTIRAAAAAPTSVMAPAAATSLRTPAHRPLNAFIADSLKGTAPVAPSQPCGVTYAVSAVPSGGTLFRWPTGGRAR